MPQQRSPTPTRHPHPSNPPSSPTVDRGDAESEGRYKRLYSALQEKVANDTSTKKRKKPTSTTRLGRGIRRLVTLYDDVAELILQSDHHQLALEGEEDEDDPDLVGLDDDSIVVVKRNRERCFTGFKQLTRLIPTLQKKIDESEPEEFRNFCVGLQNGANDARSDDVMKLKAAVANWVNDMSPQPNPRLDPRTRTSRGLQHDTTGRLLCPIDFDWDDPEVRAKIRAFDPQYDYASSFFVRCLYSKERGDTRNVEKGFLKSALLVNTYKYVFTAPTSTGDPVAEESDEENLPPRQRTTSSRKSRRKDVAMGLHMNEQVTPRSIAYAAVQLHFALSDATQWVQVHHGFDYRAFYFFIIDFFEVTPGPIARKKAQELLKWWNVRVFPNSSTLARRQASTSQKKLDEQRAANERRN